MNLTWSPVYTAFFEAYTHKNSWCDTSNKKITFIDEEGKIIKAIVEALDLAKKGFASIDGVNNNFEAFSGKEGIFKTCVYPGVQSSGREFDNRGVEWDLINMPLFEKASFGCGSSGVGVFNRTKNISSAAALALFFLTPEGQRAFNAGSGGSVPLLKSLDDEDFKDWKYPDDPDWSTKNWDAFVYLADVASTPGQVKCRMPIEVAEQIDGQIKTILTNDLKGSTSCSDGFKELETRCNEIWALLTV